MTVLEVMDRALFHMKAAAEMLSFRVFNCYKPQAGEESRKEVLRLKISVVLPKGWEEGRGDGAKGSGGFARCSEFPKAPGQREQRKWIFQSTGKQVTFKHQEATKEPQMHRL